MNNLLALAKDLGKRDAYIGGLNNEKVFYFIDGEDACIEFELEDPAQMVELMEYWKISVNVSDTYAFNGENPFWYANKCGDRYRGEGKTPMESVLNCALNIMEVRK